MTDVAQAIESAVSTAGQAVVRIGRGWGRGAGVVLADGKVMTNAHNLRSEQVTVTFADGRSEVGTVAGVDVDGDVAVIDVDTGDAPAIVWADEESPPLGAMVLTVTVDAVAGTRVTTGRVSAVGAAFRSPRGRLVRDAIEHTAPLARGSSGGPLLDEEGRALGINTHRRGDGFYLAIPATEAFRDRLTALAGGEPVRRARLGIAVAPPHVARKLREAVGLPDVEGLLVREVEEGGPADAAGVRRGDLLIEAGERPLRSSDDLFSVLDALAPGATLTLRVLRGTEEETLTASFDAPGAT